MEKAKEKIKQILQLLKEPMMGILPGQLAFFLVLSMIPLLTLIGALSSLFSISLDSIVDFLSKSVPEEVMNILLPFIKGKGIDVNVVIFMLTGFLAASKGTRSIILASNTLFKIKPRNPIVSTLKAYFLTVLLVILFFFTLVVLGLGDLIINWVINLKLLSHFSEEMYYIFSLAKYPIALLFIYLGIRIIYSLAPDEMIPSKYMKKGAFVSSLGFILVTAIYSYYVSNFANYDLFYGSLSNMIILMFWVYILSYIMVFGIALNASYYQEDLNKIEKKAKTKKSTSSTD